GNRPTAADRTRRRGSGHRCAAALGPARGLPPGRPLRGRVVARSALSGRASARLPRARDGRRAADRGRRRRV
ncbi:MAG: hypothetical protein AVDCRST_MAG17-2339, partial [uncultured Solirubrobacterales bacterium]